MNERPVRLKPNLPYQLTIDAPGKVGFDTHDPQPLGPNEVRIATLYSGISAGTEMTAFLGTSPFLNRHWDPQQRLFVEGDQSWTFPMAAMGYEEVGRVVEVGTDVTKVENGQVIWGTWRHRSEHVASEEWSAMRVLAPGVDPKLGIFSQIGAIALNAVIDANIHLGEYVAVFGQGVPGLMVTQLARLNGATVIAVDRMASRLEHAAELGAAHTIDASQGDVAAQIRSITDGRGADVSIEISGAWPALHEAIRSTAYNSRVIACGFFQGEGQGLRLGEEFHHNRVAIICSQISGLNPGLDHRWDRSRLDRTVMGLIAEGRVDFGRLISHVVPALGAQEAFDMLREKPSECLQVVLDFQA